MAANVPPQQLAQWKEAFSCFADPHSAPGTGTISTRDLGQLLRALGKNPSQEDLQNLFKRVDAKGTGDVDFNGFCACMMEQMRPVETEKEVLEAFKAFDKDHSGKMSVTEFQTVMRNFGETLNDDEVDQLLTAAQACEDSPGVIDYRKLARVLITE